MLALAREYGEARLEAASALARRLGSPTWNGKLQKLGCAGYCGTTRGSSIKCADALRKGYACATSDMGHTVTTTAAEGSDGVWAYGNLQAKVDWGFRATHVATLASKAIVARYYGSPAKRSYFLGCSTGGRQGLQEAQRFPWDFDGIVAGAPPVRLSTTFMSLAWALRAAGDANGQPLLAKKDLELLHAAVTDKCDLDDGVRDGVIGDPVNCSFDPAVLTCGQGGEGGNTNCLTRVQTAAVKKIYDGPTTSDGRRLSLGGPLMGSELAGWPAFVAKGSAPAPYERIVAEGFRFLLFMPEAGPTWNLADLDFDRDYKRLGLAQSLYGSDSADLRGFKQSGGKLLVFHGLNDGAVLPRETVDYYEAVERMMGGREETQNFFRLFLLPGSGHCGGGPSADSVDYLSAIEAWVETGTPPDRLIAARMKEHDRPSSLGRPVDPAKMLFSRPVYPYPWKARYKGHGDINRAENFERIR